LICWLDSMRSKILPQGCVSHSESYAELRWMVSEMFINHQKGETWCDDWWCCTTNLMFHILCPSLLILLRSSLHSPLPHISFPVTISHPSGPSNKFGKMSHHSHIKLPTQPSRDSISWGLGSITRILVKSSWELDSWVVHSAVDPIVVLSCASYLDKVCSPPNYFDILSNYMVSGVVNVEETVGK